MSQPSTETQLDEKEKVFVSCFEINYLRNFVVALGHYAKEKSAASDLQKWIDRILTTCPSKRDAANQQRRSLLEKDEREHQSAVEEQSAVEKLEALSWDGCLTGDCPHSTQADCDAHLAARYKEVFGQ